MTFTYKSFSTAENFAQPEAAMVVFAKFVPRAIQRESILSA